MTERPLEGIRVLEMGQLIAGPFAGCMLGYFGAEDARRMDFRRRLEARPREPHVDALVQGDP